MAGKLGRAAQLQFERQSTGFTLDAAVPFDDVRATLASAVLDVNLDTSQLLGR